MTVKDLLEVIGFEKEIYIKPSGRRTYYDGTTKKVPKCLMNMTVREIVTEVNYESDERATKRYYGGFGIYVDSDSALDCLVDAIPNIVDTDVNLYDGCFQDFINDPEKGMKELAEMKEIDELMSNITLREDLLKLSPDLLTVDDGLER